MREPLCAIGYAAVTPPPSPVSAGGVRSVSGPEAGLLVRPREGRGPHYLRGKGRRRRRRELARRRREVMPGPRRELARR